MTKQLLVNLLNAIKFSIKKYLLFLIDVSIFIEMKFMENNEMDDLFKIFKALGDKNRLRIIKMSQQRSCCVCEITAVLEIATSTVSSHLSVLKDIGIIVDVKDGKWVDYYFNTKTSNAFLNGLMLLLTFCLNNDEQVKADLEKLHTTNGDELCKT